MCRKKTQNIEFPCSVCNQNVNNNHLAILCTNCDLWSHNRCNDINKNQYREYQLNKDLSFFA